MAKHKRTAQPRRIWRRIYLREYLEARGWDQAELAKRSDVSTAEISLIINKRSAGSAVTLEKIADTLGLPDVGELFRPPVAPHYVRYSVAVPEHELARIAEVLAALLRQSKITEKPWMN